jgi:hypothetical protein
MRTSAILLFSLLSGTPKPAPAPATAPAATAPAAEPDADTLRPMARMMLRERMGQHAVAMNQLVGAVLLLRYDEAHQAAELILDQPAWSKVGPNSDAFNASLPSSFFVHQQALRDAARQLSAASAAHDPKAMGVHFGQLTQACIACHAIFLPPAAPSR